METVAAMFHRRVSHDNLFNNWLVLYVSPYSQVLCPNVYIYLSIYVSVCNSFLLALEGKQLS